MASKVVFEKLEDARRNAEGIELSSADVWLLMEMAGEEIHLAGDRWDEWQERFKEFEAVQAIVPCMAPANG